MALQKFRNYSYLFYRTARSEGLHSALRKAAQKLISEKINYLNREAKIKKTINSKNKFTKYIAPININDISSIKPNHLTGGVADGSVYIIIPDFGVGSGGHSTIFRFVQQLAWHGKKCHFLVHSPHTHFTSEEVRVSINQHFRHISQMRATLFTSPTELQNFILQQKGETIIGTCWKSIIYSLAARSFEKRIAFVQDREGLFSAYGSESVIADSDFIENYCDVVTAGKWLKTHYRNANYFDLSADVTQMRNLSQYKLKHKPNQVFETRKKIKIAFYSRWSSPRRAVDLGWEIFKQLKLLNEDYEFEVHAFGQKLGNTSFSFDVVDHGKLDQISLNQLLMSCDVGIAFSTTNYSILPIEMIAAGLLTFDLDTSANRISYEGVKEINLLNPLPSLAVHELNSKLIQLCECEKDKNKFTKVKSWEDSFSRVFVNNFHIKKEINPVNISVCIPVFNAESTIERLLTSLNSQKHVKIELNIIDSSSDDETISLINEIAPSARIKTIKQSEFQHGKTRNELFKMCSHEYVLFLTQDVCLFDEYTCRSMIDHMCDERASLVFCRHVSNPEHGPFVARDIESHFFEIFKHHARPLSLNSSCPRNIKRFSSDNCALYRRSALEEEPFANVDFGEDQLWASKILEKGGSKCYLNTIAIMHSHDEYDGGVEARAYTETIFFKKYFHENFSEDWYDLMALNRRDTNYAKEYDIHPSLLQRRKSYNKRVCDGRRAALLSRENNK